MADLGVPQSHCHIVVRLAQEETNTGDRLVGDLGMETRHAFDHVVEAVTAEWRNASAGNTPVTSSRQGHCEHDVHCERRAGQQGIEPSRGSHRQSEVKKWRYLINRLYKRLQSVRNAFSIFSLAKVDISDPAVFCEVFFLS